METEPRDEVEEETARTIAGLIAAKRFCQLLEIPFSIDSKIALDCIEAVDWALALMAGDGVTILEAEALLQMEGAL